MEFIKLPLPQKTYLVFETKLILTKIHLFIKRCRDANGKVIKMTKFLLSSHSVLPTIGSWDVVQFPEQSDQP